MMRILGLVGVGVAGKAGMGRARAAVAAERDWRKWRRVRSGIGVELLVGASGEVERINIGTKHNA
jgi:hypothetical protein